MGAVPPKARDPRMDRPPEAPSPLSVVVLPDATQQTHELSLAARTPRRWVISVVVLLLVSLVLGTALGIAWPRALAYDELVAEHLELQERLRRIDGRMSEIDRLLLRLRLYDAQLESLGEARGDAGPIPEGAAANAALELQSLGTHADGQTGLRPAVAWAAGVEARANTFLSTFEDREPGLSRFVSELEELEALRGLDAPTAAIEAQCGVIGNVGFLGLPMFVVLFGEASIGPMMLILATDLIVFSSLIVILINGSRDGGLHRGILRTIGMGLLRNPMIVSITAGMTWSALAIPIPEVMNDFLTILGGAATPGALFAIGASLAGKSAERIEVAGWLTFCKLVIHPICVAFGVLVFFPLDAFSATIAVSAAAMPVAGNVFMLAQHYGVAPQRVSAAILFSTAASIVTLPLVISWMTG